MNYLKVPDSDIKLTDGSVVMLARFPGTKWVVHYGWYDYSGRRGMGWYFASIPAQTVIPVTAQDLQLIVLVDQGSKYPEPPAPPCPCPPRPGPGPRPGPWPPVPPVPPEPGPDSGLYPAPPDPPSPPGDPRAYFSKNDQFLLDAAFITLPSMKYRDALPTVCNIPDGKIVRINSVDGVTRYYAWNAPDQRWDEKFFENNAEKLLVNYYDKEEVDEFIENLTNAVNALDNQTQESVTTLQNNIDAEKTAREDAIQAEIEARVAADEAEAIARAEADEAEAFSRAEGDQNEREARVAADEEERQARIQADSQEAETRAAADREEAETRAAADREEAQAREDADADEARAREAADAAEAHTRELAVNQLSLTLNNLTNRLDNYETSIDGRFDTLASADEVIAGNLQALKDFVEQEIESLKERVQNLEDAVFSIRRTTLDLEKKVLVYDDGTLKSSNISIGDGDIDEPTISTSSLILATEQAVAKRVDASVTQWTSF